MRKIIRWIVIGGIFWALIVLTLAMLSEPTPENLTYFFAISGSGAYTALLWLTRRWWLPALTQHPLRNAMLLGIANAAIIEAYFLGLQTLFGAQGIAAHPNLLLDWLFTMPWYIGMVILFVRAQAAHRFGGAVVLLLGGLYEIGGDGIVGGLVMPMLFGEPANLFEWAGFIALIAFWEFILVYSSMVLPPTWVIDSAPPVTATHPAWQAAMLPMLWIVPFTLYLGGMFVVLAFLGVF